MTQDPDYAQLTKYVEDEDYLGAVKTCRGAIARGENPHFWQTQLGYVSFLNERDTQSFYVDAPAIFESLAKSYPEDENAHFWLGYCLDIAGHDQSGARQEMYEVLRLSSDHPYANLVLAGLVEQDEAIRLLHRVLLVQPTNFRALRQLVGIFLTLNRKKEAVRLLNIIRTKDPCVENRYGIMNEYINGVFTHAVWGQKAKEEANALLQRISTSGSD